MFCVFLDCSDIEWFVTFSRYTHTHTHTHKDTDTDTDKDKDTNRGTDRDTETLSTHALDGDITNSGVSGVVGFYCCRRTCTIISTYHLFLINLTRRGTSIAILNA
jgi:hypothetical protein